MSIRFAMRRAAGDFMAPLLGGFPLVISTPSARRKARFFNIPL